MLKNDKWNKWAMVQRVYWGFTTQGWRSLCYLPTTMLTSQLKRLLAMRHHFKVPFISVITTYRVHIPFQAVPQTLTFSSTVPCDVSIPITPSSVSQWHLSSVSVVTVPVSLTLWDPTVSHWLTEINQESMFCFPKSFLSYSTKRNQHILNGLGQVLLKQ